MPERCLFCLMERELTKEHLISRPVADAFGIDRGATAVTEFDIPDGVIPDLRSMRELPLSTMTVRAVCGPCNNGWMSALEVRVADVFRAWLDRHEVPRGGAVFVRRWLATRLLIWCARDGGHRDLGERLEQGGQAAVPNYTRARLISAADPDALDGLECGMAAASGSFSYGFGNARTVPSGYGTRFTGVLALRLAPLELWVADTAVPATRIILPSGVRPIRDSRHTAPRKSEGPLSPDRVAVHFDKLSLDAAFARLARS